MAQSLLTLSGTCFYESYRSSGLLNYKCKCFSTCLNDLSQQTYLPTHPLFFSHSFFSPHVAAKEPHCRLCLTFFPPLVSLHTRDTNVSVCLCWVIVQPLHLYFVSLIERKRDSPQGEPRLAQPVLWRATQGLKRATQTLLVAVEMMGRLECVWET